MYFLLSCNLTELLRIWIFNLLPRYTLFTCYRCPIHIKLSDMKCAFVHVAKIIFLPFPLSLSVWRWRAACEWELASGVAAFSLVSFSPIIAVLQPVWFVKRLTRPWSNGEMFEFLELIPQATAVLHHGNGYQQFLEIGGRFILQTVTN